MPHEDALTDQWVASVDALTAHCDQSVIATKDTLTCQPDWSEGCHELRWVQFVLRVVESLGPVEHRVECFGVLNTYVLFPEHLILVKLLNIFFGIYVNSC